jgi:eukaryotic-like serine/threonine-protein kinase
MLSRAGLLAARIIRQHMALQAGTRLGPYEVVAPVGAGGMGEVWLATELRLGRNVALKLLPPDLTRDPTRILRFEQEARAASALNHPNVCTIYALDQTIEGQHYIAMEYVDGETLRQRLTGTRLSIRESLEIAIQIAAALSVAHAAGIVHRDIKPENVMLRPDAVVKVLDFGLAKLAVVGPPGAETTQLGVNTDAGTAVGTAAYMSPEQARGQQVDARTDIWSLGVMLYEMVAGRSPFVGPSPTDVLAGILQNEPAPVARFEPDAPAELQRIVTKTLRKDRSQRYQSVQDLLLDLQALREELQSHARVGSTPIAAISTEPASGSRTTAIPLPPPRRPWWLAVAAAVIFLGVLLAVWSSRTARPAQSPIVQRDTPVEHHLTRLTFGSGLQTDATFSSDGRFIAYAADRAGNFDVWVQPVAGGEPIQITKSSTHETQPDWSPDSSMIAYRSEADGGGIHVIPALGGTERRLAQGGYRPRFSPDGGSVMFLSSLEHETTNVARPDVYLVPSGGGAPRRLFERFWDQVGEFYHIDWHPDGTRVSFTGAYGNVSGFFTVPVHEGIPVLSATPQRVAQPFTFGFGGGDDAASERLWLHDFRWSTTGTRVFFSGFLKGLQNLWSIDVDPATLVWRSDPARLTAGSGADTRLTLSPDGQRIAFTVRRETTRVWVIPFDDRRGRTNGDGQPLSADDFTLTNFDLSRDGRRLAFLGWLPGAGRRQLWEIMVESGERQLRLSDDLTRGFVRYSRSSDALAFDVWGAPKTLRILRGSTVQERIVAHADLMYPFDWTLDETAIIGSATDSIRQPWYVAAWPIAAAPHAEKRVTVMLRDPTLSLWGARYSPDGKWLCFNAHGTTGNSIIGVATASGPADRSWSRVTDGKAWADKPRWSPDGRMLYYFSSSEGGIYNLHGLRFDPATGRTVGSPIQITAFRSPAHTISPNLGDGELSVAPGRLALPILEASGSVWMLDNVDK